MTGFEYRSDVDGLRAISVSMVLLFHVGFGFPGGYVGVDVFFVISGFLITNILLKERQIARSGLVGFWSRRIRRILPAATLMVAVTLVIGAVIMIPRDLESLAKSAVAQQLIASNIFFWRDVGYFKGPAELKPLLHTWSLAVEEQFYLVYPFMLVFLRRFSGMVAGSVLAAIAIVSFGLSEWAVHDSQSAAFYLLPTRAWELLLGGLICFIPIPGWLKTWQSNVLGGVGIGGILSSALLFDSMTPFPGKAALVPCLGAAVLIYANSLPGTWTNRLLSIKPLVFIGLISYSLYLWHWPLIAFCKYLLPDGSLPIAWSGLILAASFGLAFLSWYCVERPLRQHHDGSQLRRAFLIIGGGLLVTITASMLIYLSGGLPGRFSEPMLACIDDVTWTGKSALGNGVRLTEGGLTRLGNLNSSDKPRVLVWGDSHTMMCVEVLDQVARSAKVGVLLGSTAGTPPAPGLWRALDPGTRLIREKANQELLEAAKRPEIMDVILIARWSAYVEGYSDADLANEERDNLRNGFLVVDEHSLGVSNLEALAALERCLSRLVIDLHRAGKTVWIVKQVPEVHQPVAIHLLRSLQFGWPMRIGTVTRQDHLNRQSRVNRLIDQLKSDGVQVVDPSDRFFDGNDHVVQILNGRSVYKDNDHLSRSGATQMLKIMFSDIFARFKN